MTDYLQTARECGALIVKSWDGDEVNVVRFNATQLAAFVSRVSVPAEPVAQVVQISMPGLQDGRKAVVIRAINGWVPKIDTKLYLAPPSPAAKD